MTALLALGGVLLAGCGQKSGDPVTLGQADTASAQTHKPKIAVSIPAADHGWTAGIGWWAEQATKMHPECEWIIETAQNSGEQINDLENLAAQGLDGIVILATESAPVTPAAQALKDKGIYIVNVDRGFTTAGLADLFIEGDNRAFGRKSAEYIVDKLGKKGKVLILRGIPSTVDTDRYEAAMEVFKANPGVQVLDAPAAEWNREKATNVMQAMLAKHKEINAIWAADDDMALGAEIAIKEAGRENQIWMLGGAGMKDVVKRVMDGDKMFPADITYPPSMIALGIHMAAANLRDGKKDDVKKFMPKSIKFDVDIITPENAKDYYFPDSVY
jgi:ribose transport system substrate-binding protein